jgi:hypothetical protein
VVLIVDWLSKGGSRECTYSVEGDLLLVIIDLILGPVHQDFEHKDICQEVQLGLVLLEASGSVEVAEGDAIKGRLAWDGAWIAQIRLRIVYLAAVVGGRSRHSAIESQGDHVGWWIMEGWDYRQ